MIKIIGSSADRGSDGVTRQVEVSVWLRLDRLLSIFLEKSINYFWVSMKNEKKCNWALSEPLQAHYHDVEWGVPVHNDRLLFELLTLEGAQAGLSWVTILKKREEYRKVFDNFEAGIIATYDDNKINSLLANPGIVRNKLKVNSVISNAKAFLTVQEGFGSFDEYIWLFVDGRPFHNAFKTAADIPVSTRVSEIMSKDLKKRGFKFVGATICYAFMQATGMVNDHTTDCFRYAEIKRKYS